MKNNNKTIAIFSAYYFPHLGGIETYIDNMMKEFVKKNIKVILVTTNYNNSKDIEKINDIEIIRLPIFNIFRNRYPIIKHNNKERELIKELDKYSVDAIIVNTRFHLTSHVGAKYGKKRGIPVYLIEHGSNYVTVDNKFLDFFANRYEDFLTWKIKNKIEGFYGVSNACSDWLQNFNIKASGTWYNSINTNMRLPEKTNHKEINFLFAGRLIKQKGVENILEAFTRLQEEYENINLFIAGDGPEFEKYKSLYRNKKIKFLGKLNKENLFKYYAQTDVFLYPPLWPEGLPTSLLEAGLMKCAAIVTNQGGIKEVVTNRKNGIIVKTSSNSLYNAMKELIDNKELRNNLSKQLHEDVLEKFSWKKTIERVLEEIARM